MKRFYYCFLFLLLTSLLGVSAQTSSKLSGTVISSSNYRYDPKRAFDNNPSTYFLSWDASNSWVGLDLKSAQVITKIEFVAGGYNMQTGMFEGANDPSFKDAVPLHLVKEKTIDRTVYQATINVSKGFRYVRYVSANNTYCNVNEISIYGYAGEGKSESYYQITNLPTVVINTNSKKDITTKTYVEGNFSIIDGGKLVHHDELEVRGRGNASWQQEKKGFRVKLNSKTKLLDATAKSKNWTLIAAYSDKTLIRSLLAFDMSNKFGLYYTPYCRAVDFVVNGEYRGTYMLCDQIEVRKNRIDIDELEPTDTSLPNLSGGYLLEIDGYANREPEQSYFISKKNLPVTIKSPKDDAIVPAQKKYISDHFNKMEQAMHSTDYQDPIIGYQKYLNAENFAKYFVFEEFVGNMDALWSVYMIKQRNDDQLYTGPGWDFDWTFQNPTNGFISKQLNEIDNYWSLEGGSQAGSIRKFVNRALTDSTMQKQMRNVWTNAKKQGVSVEYLTAKIKSLQEEVDQSRALNFVRWPSTAPSSYTNEVAIMRNYALNRISWLDRKILSDSKAIITRGTYKLKSISTENVLTDNNGLSTSPYIASSEQDWIIKPVGTSYSIVSRSTNLALTNDNSGNLSTSKYSGGTNQLWMILKDENGSFRIMSNLTNQILSNSNGSISMAEYEKNSNQLWKLSHTALYIIGSATSAKWDLTKASKMTLNSNSDGLFVWEGRLTAGSNSFKFLSDNTAWDTSINFNGNKNQKVNLGESYDVTVNTKFANDYQFAVANDGFYKVTIDMDNMSMNVDVQQPEVLYIVGTATSTGWSNTKAESVVYSEVDSTYNWSGSLKAGEFKFIATLGSWSNSVTATAANSYITPGATHKLTRSISTDYKYLIREPGEYTIKVNLRTSELYVTKEKDKDPIELYIAGAATSTGWSNTKAEPVIYSEADSTYNWTGYLKTGQFKFLTTLGTWNNSITAIAANSYITSGTKHKLTRSTATDYKYVIREAGEYRVKVNLFTEELYITKIGESKKIYIVGAATSAGWSNTKAEPVIYSEADGTYNWTGYLKTGEFKFLTTLGTWNNSITATVPDSYIIPGYQHTLRISGSTDYKYLIREAGEYNVKVNLVKQELYVDKIPENSAVYMFGSSTPNGWDRTNAQNMTLKEGAVYTWSGALKAGEFKFITQNNADYPSINAKAGNVTITPGNIEGAFLSYHQSYDSRFVLTSAGNYNIELDIANKTLLVTNSLIRSMVMDSDNAEFTIISQYGYVTVSPSNDITITKAELINTSGNIIDIVKSKNHQFELGHNAPAGTYIVRLYYNNKHYVQKVIIK